MTLIPAVDVQPTDEEKNIILRFLESIGDTLAGLPQYPWFWPAASALTVAIATVLLWRVLKAHPWVLIGVVVALTLIGVSVFR